MKLKSPHLEPPIQRFKHLHTLYVPVLAFCGLWLSGLMILGVSGRGAVAEEVDWRAACKRLVQQMVAPSGIDNRRILEVMQETPRHQFVPTDQRENAY